MRLILFGTAIVAVAQAAGLLNGLFGRKDKCRCEGQWEVDMDSWQEPRGKGGLKPMGKPIVSPSIDRTPK